MSQVSSGKQPMTKLDSWRVIPRVLVALYAFQFARVCEWFMGLPDPSATQAAFVSTVVGAAAAFFGLYVNSGGKRE